MFAFGDTASSTGQSARANSVAADSPSKPILLRIGTHLANLKQITGNIGLYHVACELSRAGWNVMPTARNARGADIYAASEDERIIHPIQIKAHSAKPADTQMGLHPERLVTPWWVFVAHARSPTDICCYVVTLDEVRKLIRRDPGSRTEKPEHECVFWFDRRFYTPGSDRELTRCKNAWHRLGIPRFVE